MALTPSVDRGDIIRGPPVPVHERYFTKYFTSKRVIGENDDHSKPLDQCVLCHSNKLCVICISPLHPLITDDSIEIESINFKNDSFDLTNNQVHGKRKRGGYHLMPNSPLCQVNCKDGKCFILHSCVKGYLVEVNERIKTDPCLLRIKPLSEGYLAIISQKLSETSFKDLLQT